MVFVESEVHYFRVMHRGETRHMVCHAWQASVGSPCWPEFIDCPYRWQAGTPFSKYDTTPD